MNETPKPEELARERRQILTRAIAASGLIAALLGVLVVVERGNAPTPAPAPTPQRVTPPAPPRASQSLPPQLTEAIRTSPDAPQVEQTQSGADTDVPRLPQVVEETADVATEQALGKAPEPVPPATLPARPAERPATEATARAAQPRSDAQRPPTAPADRLVLAPSPAPVAAPAGSYVVQMGVFANVANAEELRAKLSLAGIPSVLETRVQLGPFASRAQALAAQQKLRELGLAPGMLVVVPKH